MAGWGPVSNAVNWYRLSYIDACEPWIYFVQSSQTGGGTDLLVNIASDRHTLELNHFPDIKNSNFLRKQSLFPLYSVDFVRLSSHHFGTLLVNSE